MVSDVKKRVVIENVQPEIDCGCFPIKRVVGEKVVVQADIFAHGHDDVGARLLYRKPGEEKGREVEMKGLGNDRWEGTFTVEEIGVYYYSIQGWIDYFQTWQKDLQKRFKAKIDVRVDLLIGAEYIKEVAKRASGADRDKLRSWAEALSKERDIAKAFSIATSGELISLMKVYQDKRWATTYGKELAVVVDRREALFSAWYEMFPRSCSPEPDRHGTFRDCEALIPEIAGMGFDVLYLPPIHPIGKTNRKGKNNSPLVEPGDPGSPWAIGSEEGGHKAVHPQLGTLEDFERLVKKAKDYGIEIAMDLAYQCTPDHPYVKEHPEWFRWRPDGTVQYAENPPKKYEDIIPFNFETRLREKGRGRLKSVAFSLIGRAFRGDNSKDMPPLWEELKSIVIFWVGRGIRIFRVDNPHTKPYPFWEWFIKEIKREHPEVIFLSEAFTRPKIMYLLAKLGFTQSYTYFTWRNTKREITDYLIELTQSEVREYFRPNFWPNTPDILPEHLQYGGRPAFIVRLVLAATLSSSYGIYGPAFELCINEAMPGREEYLNSEKYEIRHWDRDKPESLKDFIVRVNRIRKENPALQTTWNLRFYGVDNDYILFYGKAAEDLSNIILVVVNLDPYHTHSGWVRIPIWEFGMDPDQPYLVHDLLSDDKYIWQGEKNYVELNPQVLPAHIFRIRKKLKRETDFDYFI